MSNLNIPRITINELSAYMEVFIRLNIPLMIWGPPGVGKTEIVKQVATSLDRKLVRLRIGSKDPADIDGVPFPVYKEAFDGKTRKFTYLTADWVPEEEINGIIFLDEITHAREDVQAGAYDLVLEGKAGDFQIPKSWWRCAAGNRLDDGAISYVMGSALASRFAHVEVIPDAASVIEYGLNNNWHPYVLSFLKVKPELVCNLEDAINKGHLIHVNSRNWERVSNILKEFTDPDFSLLSEVSNIRELEKNLIEAVLGTSVTTEFIITVSECRELKPLSEMLAAVRKYENNPTDANKKALYKTLPSKTSAIFSLMYSIPSECKKEVKEILDALKLINYVANNPNLDLEKSKFRLADFEVAMVTAMGKVLPQLDHKSKMELFNSDEWRGYMIRHPQLSLSSSIKSNTKIKV